LVSVFSSVNASPTRSTSGMGIPMTLFVHSLFSIFLTSRLSIIIPFRLLLLLIDPFFSEVRAGSASHSFFSPSIVIRAFSDVLVLLLYLHSFIIGIQTTNNVPCESARPTFFLSINQKLIFCFLL
jgi:type III secretory pathway component EscT